MKSAPRSSSSSKPRPWAPIAVLPFVAAAAAVAVVYFSISARLPEPLATHFGGVGSRADGFTSTRGFLTLTLTLLLVFGAVFGLLARLPEPSELTPWLIAGGYALAAAIGFLACRTLFANAGATDTSEVRLPLWELAVTLAVALLAGALGRLLAGPAPRPSGRTAGEGPGSTSRRVRRRAGRAPSARRRSSRSAPCCSAPGSSPSFSPTGRRASACSSARSRSCPMPPRGSPSTAAG
ncbi:hypothetical protein O1L68_09540 [Streptomyces lydicus]|nr:hypothetical protein [Streptomyces lydicus]